MRREITLHCYLTFVLLACGEVFYTIIGAQISEKNTMIKKLTACDTFNFVENSSYFSDCRTEIYYDTYQEGDGNAKCMILYGVIDRICNHNSRINVTDKKAHLSVPQTAVEFDSTLEKLKLPSKDPNEVSKILCDSIKSFFDLLKKINIQPPDEILPYEKNFIPKLLSENECQYICHAATNETNKFCMLLFWANSLFSTVKSSILQDTKLKNNTIEQSSIITTQLAKQNTSITINKPQNDTQTKIKQKKSEQLPESSKTNSNHNSENVEQPSKVIADTVINNGNKSQQKQEITKSDQKQNEEKNTDKKQNEQEPSGKKKDSKPQDVIETPIQLDLQEHPGTLGSEEEEHKKNEADSQDQNQGNLNPISQSDKLYTPKANKSHFFVYFLITCVCCILIYIGYHNKQKILAMLLEGRRGRRGRGRRPSTASYRKLDSNLEEAVTSQCSSNVRHVIY